MVTVDDIIQRATQSEDPAGNFLRHRGVKGMKWGVRKRRTPAGPATVSVKSLSNDDLRKHIERMNLEQQYNNLAKGKRNNSEAKDFVKGLGKTLVSTAVSMAATQQIAKVLKKVG